MDKQRQRLLILSYAFSPSIGGIETVSELLARSLTSRSYDVTIVTSVSGTDDSEEPFRIVRKPSIFALIREIRRAEIVLQSNISLRLSWPLWVLFPRKPFILVHHTPITRPDGRLALVDRFKQWLLWRPYCLSVSNYLAGTIKARSRVVPNPYESTIFRVDPHVKRDFDLIFVGRLVPAKGADTLLRAFKFVVRHRPQSSLMIVGEGPEADPLRKLANSLGIQDRTKFLGSKRGAELAGLMNQHKVLVVPSRSQPPEALSVVVIEGIACGCIPVASRQGGLPDAVGEVGVLFEEGNVDELAEILLRLLDAPELSDFYGAKIELHLRQFSPETVADAYESHFMACNRP